VSLLSPPVASKVAESHGEAPPEFSKEALAGWFLLRVHTWPKDAPLPIESQCRAAAELYFRRKIPRDSLRDVRRSKVPQNWLKTGPRNRR
jgi:hypothetical protein